MDEEELKKRLEMSEEVHKIVTKSMNRVSRLLCTLQLDYVGEAGRSEAEYITLYVMMNRLAEDGLIHLYKQSSNPEGARKYTEMINKKVKGVKATQKQVEDEFKNRKD